jgi:predicted alpha/beta superfamily hydrolase
MTVARFKRLQVRDGDHRQLQDSTRLRRSPSSPGRAASLLSAVALLALGLPAAAQGSAPSAAAAVRPLPAEVSIPNTRHLEFVSKVNGHRYALDVALPFDPAPAKGYRVLYVLDGNDYFASATEAVRVNGNAPGVIVVGIGYPNDERFIKQVLDRHRPLPPQPGSEPSFQTARGIERQYDLRLPASEAVLAGQVLPGFPVMKPADVGGLDDFLKTIETEVKPRVAALAPVDPDQQVLFGHSLGGLAVIEALFSEPGAFRTFVAASPSIWWGESAVLAKEAAFSAEVASGAAHPRVLITVGAEEAQLPKLPPSMAAALPQLQKLVAKARMVGNACDLAGRLKALHGAAPYEVADCAVFSDQGHNLSPWPALGRAVSFAFQP